MSRNGRVLVWSMEDDGEWRGSLSTLNTSGLHSGGAGCSSLPCLVSLSSVLETGPIPPRFFLSETACAGILRRAEKRGKELPTQLLHALQAVAGVSGG